MISLAELVEGVIHVTQHYPAPLLALFTLPFLLAAWWGRIYPSKNLVMLCIVPAALTFLLTISKNAISWVIAIDLAVMVVAAIDLFTLPRRNAFQVERRCQRIASLRQKHRVELDVDNLLRRSTRVWIRDGVPQEMAAEPNEFQFLLQPRTRTTMHYELLALQRGAFELDAIHLRILSRLGLWDRYVQIDNLTTVHVYPDMKQLSEYTVLARTNRLSLLGVRRTRQVGQDNDFERLRDYTLDDNYRHIDWRSTARRNKLTVRDFQTSQSQRIVFMMDCGRMMTNQTDGISLLDHGLNAMLMLSYVALLKGDSVGLITFSDRIHSFVPPKGGKSHMNQMLHASFDRFPRLVESRYEDAFLYLSSHCRKRSMVVLMTNVIDDVNSQQIYRHLSSINGRHLPLLVLLRDHALFAPLENDINNHHTSLYHQAAAAEIVAWRKQVLTDLQHRGVLTLDLFPENLTAPLINKYLEIKARNLI